MRQLCHNKYLQHSAHLVMKVQYTFARGNPVARVRARYPCHFGHLGDRTAQDLLQLKVISNLNQSKFDGSVPVHVFRRHDRDNDCYRNALSWVGRHGNSATGSPMHDGIDELHAKAAAATEFRRRESKRKARTRGPPSSAACPCHIAPAVNQAWLRSAPPTHQHGSS